LADAPAALPRAAVASKYWKRAAHLARARLWPFLAFAVLIQSFNVLRSASLVGFLTPLGQEAIAITATYTLIVFPPMFAAIVLTEALALRGLPHLLAAFAAIVAGQAVAMAIMLLLYGGANVPLVEAQVIVSDNAFVLRSFWFYTGAGMLLIAYFAYRERELAAAKAAQDANTQRATVERATLAARLKVMQARVEPELLFAALRDVRELYVHDHAAAETLLDDLIAYLRAALPQMRSDFSTLGREAGLAVAYAKVLPTARHGNIVVDAAIPDDAYDVAFPPMVLLPLVRAAVESRASHVAIAVDERGPTQAEVRVDPVQRPSGWDEASLEPIRAALINGLGPGATLAVTDGRAVVRWP
jgi:hypothetical protein